MTNAVNSLALHLFARVVAIQHRVSAMKDKAIEAFDRQLVRCDGWFLVLLAVLMTLAFTIVTALAIWCVVYKGKRFTGNWRWGTWGISVWVECV